MMTVIAMRWKFEGSFLKFYWGGLPEDTVTSTFLLPPAQCNIVKVVLFAVVAVCHSVSLSVNTITPELLGISWQNFGGIILESKGSQVWKWLLWGGRLPRLVIKRLTFIFIKLYVTFTPLANDNGKHDKYDNGAVREWWEEVSLCSLFQDLFTVLRRPGLKRSNCCYTFFECCSCPWKIIRN